MSGIALNQPTETNIAEDVFVLPNVAPTYSPTKPAGIWDSITQGIANVIQGVTSPSSIQTILSPKPPTTSPVVPATYAVRPSTISPLVIVGGIGLLAYLFLGSKKRR